MNFSVFPRKQLLNPVGYHQTENHLCDGFSYLDDRHAVLLFSQFIQDRRIFFQVGCGALSSYLKFYQYFAVFLHKVRFHHESSAVQNRM